VRPRRTPRARSRSLRATISPRRAGAVALAARTHERTMLGDRHVELQLARVLQARLQLRDQDPQLARARHPRAVLRAREAIPRARERQEVRARTRAMRHEHRAHAAARVNVRADDHALAREHTREHRLARGNRQAVDRGAQALHGARVLAATLSHRLRTPHWPSSQAAAVRGQA
jgi:hypothetical protein